MLTVGSTKIFAARQKKIDVRVFLDKRVIEVYANDGAVALFTTVDGMGGAEGVQAFATNGRAQVSSLRAWRMQPAGFNMKLFQP